MTNSVQILGYVSATLTTISFLPQVYLTLKSRDVSGISLSMYSIFTIGIMGWLAYGYLLDDKAILIGNAITLCCAATIWGMKFKSVLSKIRAD